ncbi:MAG: hypothetical protein N2385_10565 [Chloroflexus sp.]|nr:hypothetical protein [Chloroflexus sp.]
MNSVRRGRWGCLDDGGPCTSACGEVMTAHLSEVNFRHPVREGSIVELIARLVRTGRSSMHISVEMWWEPMDHEERVLACQAECVLVAIGDDGKPVAVPPLESAAPEE